MKQYKKYIFSFLSLILFFISLHIVFIAHATEIIPEYAQQTARVGDDIVIHLILKTKDPINVLEGAFPIPDGLTVKRIEYPNSVINFWIEKPHVDLSTNSILFSGMTPGGYVGDRGVLFSIVFEASREGSVSLALESGGAYINDGLGTQAVLEKPPVSLAIVPRDESADVQTSMLLQDTIPPVPFTPLIATDNLLFNGKSVVIFSTQDKESGIVYYKIKESHFRWLTFLSRWRDTESPAQLKDQKQQSYIFIRALDEFGNAHTEMIVPRASHVWYTLIELSIIIGFISMFIWRIKKYITRS